MSRVLVLLVAASMALSGVLAAPAASQRAPHLNLWICIHNGEGAWNDPGGPYYGGLQMGWGFMRSHAPELLARKGTADRWTPREQIWVAERAYKRSGYSLRWLYSQWPNTAPPCSRHA